jgi:hypothetical protein
VAERLGRLVSPAAQAFFVDACRLMAASNDLQTTSHLVGHLVREIESSMRAVLETLVEPIKGKDDSHRQTVVLILKVLEIPETDPVALAWLEKTGRKAKGGLHKRAHRNDLFQPRPVDEGFTRYWEEMQAVFDAILDRFEKRWVDTHKVLDRLLAKDPPGKDDVGFVLGKIPNNLVARGYFFDRLAHSSWLQPLFEEGAFGELPEALRGEGTVTFVPWPPAKYLGRMAAVPEAQETVRKVLLQLPPTDNIAIQRDLLDAILALPAAFVRDLAPRVKDWLGGSFQSPNVEERAGKLVVKLADGGETAAALALARDLFAVVPDPQIEALGRGAAAQRPAGQMDDWHYERALQQCLPTLAEQAGLEAFEMTCDLLSRAMELSGREQTNETVDHSWLWRPAIEDHAQNRHGPFQGLLVTAVRDVGHRLVEKDGAVLEQLVQRLEARRGLVFRRLALDLLARYGASRPDLVEERLLDKSRFEEPGLRHEYSRLQESGFHAMPIEQQTSLLAWIDAGPDVSGFIRRWTEEGRAAPTDADVERHRDTWRRDRLAPISAHLPRAWRERYDALRKALGEPEHPDFLSYSTRFVGPTSPTTNADLMKMPISDVVQYLQFWKPSGKWDEPTIEGLGRELTTAVAEDPGKFADGADSFRGLNATYVRSVFDGLEKALRAGRQFRWAPVLALAEWATTQPRSPGDPEESDEDRDPHWGWARKAIASLLGSGCGAIDFGERTRVWRIISALVEDPDPTPEHERDYGGSNMDPVTMSINTVRGEAMHAVFEYAIWVRQELERMGHGSAAGLDGMPEVKAVLEAHLSPSTDPSTTVRAVYGWRLPTLLWLDRGWVRRNLVMLFPSEPAASKLRAALWEAVLTRNGPSDILWEELQAEYRWEVDALTAATLDDKLPDHVEHFVGHVMQLYLHGKIGLEAGGFLIHFFDAVPEAVRAAAIDFVGRALGSPPDPTTPEMISRATALWENRLAEGRDNVASHSRELAAFGWWTRISSLALDWRVAQVATVLDLTGTIQPDFIVLEFLEEAVAQHPLEAVRCVAAIARSQFERGGFTMWSDEAKGILSTALKSGNAAAAKEAREVVNMLVARGYVGYAELLDD